MAGIQVTLKSTGQQMVAKLEIEYNTEYVYYTKEGSFLGGDLNSKKVFVVNKNEYETTLKDKNYYRLNKDADLICDIDGKTSITHHIFIAFASMVWNESSGNKEESYAIANATINYLIKGGANDLKILEDIVMYINGFSAGAKQEHIDKFCKEEHYKKNTENSISAVINALHFNKGMLPIFAYNDYSQGADAWDGIDLVSTKTNNEHRTYRWTTDSKDILSKHKKACNGGVDVTAFNYTDKKPQAKAILVLGKTVFCKVFIRGEAKTINRKTNTIYPKFVINFKI